MAYRQIHSIKNSFVLVKLKSSEKKIKFLMENNRDQEAKEIMTEIENENQDIIKAFAEEYDFSNYYFFSSDSYKDLKERNFDQVPITDKDGNEIANKDFLENDFYIISFDGAYESQFVKTNPDGTRDPAGGTFRQGEVAVLDHEFIQLIKPFPYFAGSKFGLSDDDRRDNVLGNKKYLVQDLNRRLAKFHITNFARIQHFKDDKNYTKVHDTN